MRAALAALLTATTATTGLASEPAVTRVEVEVFTVGLATKEETARFLRARGSLTGGMNPDVRAKALAAEAAPELLLIHSTSWRWEEDGRIVLTYLAWARDGGLSARAAPMPPLAPVAPTDPLHPRPKELRELDPLAHGLRHLAFLARQADGTVAAALGPRATAVLLRLDPTVAGELPRPPLPSPRR